MKLNESTILNEAPPVGGAQSGSRIYQFFFWGGGVSWNFDAEFKFAIIQNSHVEGGGGGSWNFDAEFKFAIIQNSHVEGGGGGDSWNFDAEFKFAKIQNAHVEGGWVEGLMEF